MDIIFATGNKHKVIEAAKALGDSFTLIMPKELGCNDDIPETGDTLQANAIQKCMYLWERFGKTCFADDTGLEVDALGGAPGVYTARYAGLGCSNEDNIQKLLRELEKAEKKRTNAAMPDDTIRMFPDTPDGDAHLSDNTRAARFRTVVAFMIHGELHLFEGVLEGRIACEKSGEQGFGYDPIFIPHGYDKTLAQISLDEKNSISHRGQVMRKLSSFLQQC
ncbi:MAG: non-canonical purine NTP pyrophosphatase [Bacteroidales bacterium]